MAFDFTIWKTWTGRDGLVVAISVVGGLGLGTLLWWQRPAPNYFRAQDEAEILAAGKERGLAIGYRDELNQVDTVTTSRFNTLSLSPPYDFNRFITTNPAEHGTTVTNAVGFYPRRPDAICIDPYALAMGTLISGRHHRWLRPGAVAALPGQTPDPALEVDVAGDNTNLVDAAWWNSEIGTKLTAQYGLDPQTNDPAVLPVMLADADYIATNWYSQYAAVYSRLRDSMAEAGYDMTSVYWMATSDYFAGDPPYDPDATNHDAYVAGMRLAAAKAVYSLDGKPLVAHDWLSPPWGAAALQPGSYVTLVQTNGGFTAYEFHVPVTLLGYGYTPAVEADAVFMAGFVRAAGDQAEFLHPAGHASNAVVALDAIIAGASTSTGAFLVAASEYAVVTNPPIERYSALDLIGAVVAVDDRDGLDYFPGAMHGQHQHVCNYAWGALAVAYRWAFQHCTNAAVFWGGAE